MSSLSSSTCSFPCPMPLPIPAGLEEIIEDAQWTRREVRLLSQLRCWSRGNGWTGEKIHVDELEAAEREAGIRSPRETCCSSRTGTSRKRTEEGRWDMYVHGSAA